jgi:hypothetical protein
MISNGTIAAIAASLMAQGVEFQDGSTIYDRGSKYRKDMVKDFVSIAMDVAIEVDRQVAEWNGPRRPKI